MCDTSAFLKLGIYANYISIPPIVVLLLLGLFILFSDFKKTANRIYFLISVFLIIWIASDFLSYKLSSPVGVLWADRLSSLGLFAGAFFVLFLYLFPEKERIPRKILYYVFIPLLPFFVLVPTDFYETVGPVPNCDTLAGPAYLIMAAILAYDIVLGIFFSVKKIKLLNENQKKQFKIFATGSLLMIFLGGMIDVVPSIFDNATVVLFTPYSALVFALFGAYAMVKYKALNAKIVAAQMAVISLIILIGSQLFFITNPINRVITIITLIIAVIFGWWLVNSVKKEVKQKEALALANEELKRMDQVKNEFINIASHQLRTPVTVIKGTISMLIDGTMDSFDAQTKKKFYEGASFKCKKLEDVINDILSATALTNKKFSAMDTEAEKINIREFFKKMIDGFKPEIMEREIELSLGKLDESVPDIFGQKQYLEEVFSNLITNAIKYTPSPKQTPDVRNTRTGSATIVISSRKEKDNIVFSVKDNGIGIPKKAIPGLFQKFARAKNAVDMYTDGTGLGLFIVREIVEGHGGKVWVKSVLGKGSEFFVQLPIKPTGKINIKKYIQERAEIKM
jgi:signal transduction histidine kinase